MTIWIDVGAHQGQSSYRQALQNPNLTVYAFEPLLPAIAFRFAQLPNFVVLPMAVARHNGFVTFHVNNYDQASSILPMQDEGVKNWIGGEPFRNVIDVLVPCVRLDTFMDQMDIRHVDFLKIDAQGYDLDVVKSLASDIVRVDRIQLEVQIVDFELYVGAARKAEIDEYMEQYGFRLTETHSQSFNQEENLVYERKTV